MKLISLEVIKKMPSLIPIIFATSIGVGAAILYPLRCALKAPEVSWRKKKNPEPWNDYIDKDYKLYVVKSVKELNIPPPPKY